MTAHPTPVQIRLKISEALFDDYERTKDTDAPVIPVRALRIIRKAISEACDEAAREAAQ